MLSPFDNGSSADFSQMENEDNGDEVLDLSVTRKNDIFVTENPTDLSIIGLRRAGLQLPQQLQISTNLPNFLPADLHSSSLLTPDVSPVGSFNTGNSNGDGIEFRCDVCQRVLATQRGLSRHRRIMHAPERLLFYCELCGRDFRDRRNFRNHRLAHEGIRPFTCPMCPASFSNRSSWLYHSVSHTLDGSESVPKDVNAADDRRRLDKVYKCKECGEVFAGLRELKKHKIKRSSHHNHQQQSPSTNDNSESHHTEGKDDEVATSSSVSGENLLDGVQPDEAETIWLQNETPLLGTQS